MSIAPEIPETLSPYWLRLYGHWVHLEGIAPVNEIAQGRAFSELITVDGYRYAQRAPRGPRTWALPYEYGTGAATAALESAAYDYNFDDPDMRTLFLDTNEARINMVPPDLVNTWRNPLVSSGPLVYNVGEPDGLPMWQPTYDGDGISGTRSIQIPVRGGVTYTAAVWTSNPNAGTTVLEITGAATADSGGAPGATPENPHLSYVSFTPAADGVITVAVQIGFTAGLMVYEGDCAPTSYRAGRRMPCSVAVQDSNLTTNVIWPNQNCDPCALPRQQSSFTVLEVGVDAVTPMEVVL